MRRTSTSVHSEPTAGPSISAEQARRSNGFL
jgi:hypothetical protein